VNRWQPHKLRKRINANTLGDRERVGAEIERIHAAFESVESGHNIPRVPELEFGDADIEDRAAASTSSISSTAAG
jgi:hypothetical protein